MSEELAIHPNIYLPDGGHLRWMQVVSGGIQTCMGRADDEMYEGGEGTACGELRAARRYFEAYIRLIEECKKVWFEKEGDSLCVAVPLADMTSLVLATLAEFRGRLEDIAGAMLRHEFGDAIGGLEALEEGAMVTGQIVSAFGRAYVREHIKDMLDEREREARDFLEKKVEGKGGEV